MQNQNEDFQDALKRAQISWQQGNPQAALEICARMDTIYQQHPDVLYLKGIICWSQKQLEDALFFLHAACEKGPTHWPDVHLVLGQVLRECGQLKQAKYWFERARQQDPTQAEVHYALGMLYAEMGDLKAASHSLLQACERQPLDWRYQTTRLFYLTATPGLSHQERLQEFTSLASTQLDLQAPLYPHFLNSRDPERKLRVAYVSADFRQHVAANSLSALFELADRNHFELAAYSMVSQPDHLTLWFQEHADIWRDCQTWNDQQLLEQLRRDQADILIDCSGYTFGNRLKVLAHKPAPIQLSAFGFIYTTGMRAIDYQFTDSNAVPEHCAHWYSEDLIYLSSQMIWQAPSEEISVVSPPCLNQATGVTFGSGNASYKLNSDVILVWSRILQAVPNSRLLLKHKRFELADLQQHVRNIFAQQGISPERIQFRGASKHLEHLAFYNELDIALDPFPYTGGITTCETLYMGVPVISLDGEVTRTSIPVLKAVGADELIASDRESYVACAIHLAQSPQRLVDYRKELRKNLLASPLLDKNLFVSEIETAYRDIWRAWCEETQ